MTGKNNALALTECIGGEEAGVGASVPIPNLQAAFLAAFLQRC